MSKPPTVTLPSVGGINPVIIRIEVDLPAPLGPRNPSTSPRSTEKDTPSTARLGPKVLTRLSTLIMVNSSYEQPVQIPHRLYIVKCFFTRIWRLFVQPPSKRADTALDEFGSNSGENVQTFFRDRAVIDSLRFAAPRWPGNVV